MADDEGLDFAAAFAGAFGSTDQTQSRLKAERRAGLTPRQRARKPVRIVQVNFRAAPATKALAERLAAHLDCSVADVMEQALYALAAEKKLSDAGS